jgi:hypothetical protein
MSGAWTHEYAFPIPGSAPCFLLLWPEGRGYTGQGRGRQKKRETRTAREPKAPAEAATTWKVSQPVRWTSRGTKMRSPAWMLRL